MFHNLNHMFIIVTMTTKVPWPVLLFILLCYRPSFLCIFWKSWTSCWILLTKAVLILSPMLSIYVVISHLQMFSSAAPFSLMFLLPVDHQLCTHTNTCHLNDETWWAPVCLRLTALFFFNPYRSQRCVWSLPNTYNKKPAHYLMCVCVCVCLFVWGQERGGFEGAMAGVEGGKWYCSNPPLLSPPSSIFYWQPPLFFSLPPFMHLPLIPHILVSISFRYFLHNLPLFLSFPLFSISIHLSSFTPFLFYAVSELVKP